jgi:hypothetical protein
MGKSSKKLMPVRAVIAITGAKTIALLNLKFFIRFWYTKSLNAYDKMIVARKKSTRNLVKLTELFL